MADAVTSQQLLDNDSVIYKFTNVSDGTGESAVTKIDVSGLTTQEKTGKACDYLVLESVAFSVTGMSVQILEDATSDVLILTLPPDSAGEIYFDDIGGLPNSKATGYTGDIKFTTQNALSGDTYSITMKFKKKF